MIRLAFALHLQIHVRQVGCQLPVLEEPEMAAKI